MKKHITAFCLALLLALGITTTCFAATTFTDVPRTFWAYDDINTMAKGGLVQGYGNGKFGPNDAFTIAHMSRIICNALGQEAPAENGYWAYNCVKYCINSLRCLPDFGPIVAGGAYDKVCTRELATYMLVNGLGITQTGNLKNVKLSDIPDWSDITDMYRDAILQSYKYGMTIGVDAKGTFQPKATLTRAQGVTMLVRAGVTTAAPIAKPTAGGVDDATAWASIKKLTDMRTYENMGIQYAVPTDPKYGGVQFQLLPAGGFAIDCHEWNDAVWVKNGSLVDVNGNPVQNEINSNGVMVTSSGFSYEARRLVYKALQCIFPTDYEKAYADFKAVMLNEVHANGGGEPRSVNWLENRPFTVSGGTHSVSIHAGVLGDKETYNRTASARISRAVKDIDFYTDRATATKWYELTKW